MNTGNPPLAQWQIDHIRKMQEELGMAQAASDAEEVTMDEDAVDEDMMGGLPQTANAADTTGGLAVYSDPNVQTSMTAFNKLAAEQQARYDAQAKALAEKRYGPSFSERMFQLSAALATPTAQRGLGGILGNITPVLAAQQKAKREGEIDRREALEQLQNNRLAAQMGLAKQGLTTSLAMARLNAMKSKPPTMKSVIVENGIAYDPVSGAKVVQPDASAWAALSAYPTQANLDNFIRTFGPRFAEQAMRAVGSATGGQR
jgi:hypothetical protein